jgi:uncharacterized protein
MTDYFCRDLAPAVIAAIEEMPVVVITGMRQTGKTTFLGKEPALTKRRYVTFDDFPQLAAAKSDPEQFVSSEEPLTIDEAHKCPEIFSAIKRAVDRKRIPGQFLLSGSANFSLLKKVTESLAGRALYFEMFPFSRREVLRKTEPVPFLKRFFENPEKIKGEDVKPVRSQEISEGGMPTVCLREVKDRSLWFKGYEQTYLERDIREISQIENLIAFRNLLHRVALRTGQLFSASQIGRDAKLSTATTSRYMSLLETTLVIARLSPYLRNKASRLIKSPKIYLGDSGLACHLAGLEEADLSPSQPFLGQMFETYVAQNILAILNSRWQEAQVFFWSVQGRNEVDFVIEAGRTCMALEIKSGTKWDERDLSGLKAFLSSTPHCKIAVLGYNGTDPVRLGDKLWALPLGLILS